MIKTVEYLTNKIAKSMGAGLNSISRILKHH